MKRISLNILNNVLDCPICTTLNLFICTYKMTRNEKNMKTFILSQIQFPMSHRIAHFISVFMLIYGNKFAWGEGNQPNLVHLLLHCKATLSSLFHECPRL